MVNRQERSPLQPTPPEVSSWLFWTSSPRLPHHRQQGCDPVDINYVPADIMNSAGRCALQSISQDGVVYLLLYSELPQPLLQRSLLLPPFVHAACLDFVSFIQILVTLNSRIWKVFTIQMRLKNGIRE
jgi:hypothetical protein